MFIKKNHNVFDDFQKKAYEKHELIDSYKLLQDRIELSKKQEGLSGKFKDQLKPDTE